MSDTEPPKWRNCKFLKRSGVCVLLRPEDRILVWAATCVRNSRKDARPKPDSSTLRAGFLARLSPSHQEVTAGSTVAVRDGLN